ncbi:pilus assembly protein FlpE [Paraoerskovia marina]|uniref:pilus assembly protein FlpE n=1 Tax=Paraoerskovia marina TaxID=545619 RepID=UPI0012DD1D5B|nr:pilus assembly protein FlpE [Paraoerskovia marina]
MAVVGVVGAHGGAGASGLAAALAVGARGRGRSVVLTELGTAGGGLDVFLGVEQGVGRRWPDLLAPGDPAVAVDDLVRWRGVDVLSADRLRPCDPGADGGARARAVLDALAAAAELVVVDAGRAPAPGAVSGLDACDGIVVVVPRTVQGVAGAIAAVRAVEDRGRVGVVDRVGGPLGRTEVSDALGRVGWGSVPDVRGFAEAVDAGAGPPVGRRDRLGAWTANELSTGPLAALCGTRA